MRELSLAFGRDVFPLTQNESIILECFLPILSAKTRLTRLKVHVWDSRLGLTQNGLDWMGSLHSIKSALIAFFRPAEGWQLPLRLIIRALQGAPLWTEHLVQIYFNGPGQNGKVLNVQPQWWHFYEISKVQKQINERFERSTNRNCDNKNSTLIYQF